MRVSDSPKSAILSKSAEDLMVENDRNSLNLRKIRRKQIKSETDLLAFDTLLSQLDFDIQYIKRITT